MATVVIGAGISGLAAARALKAKEPGLELYVLESAARVGGLVHSERSEQGMLLEHGPDSIFALKPLALDTAREIGLGDAVLDGTGTCRTSYILRGGRLLALPAGVLAFSAGGALRLIGSPLLSWKGKLRLALEPFVPPRSRHDDETVAAFVTRRLGSDFLNQLVEPLLAGIHGAPADQLSAQASLARLLEIEQRCGSIAAGMLRRKRRAPAPPAAIVSLRDGMESLVARLGARLAPTLRLRHAVKKITRLGRGFELELGERGRIRAERLVIATPALAAARLLEPLDPDLAQTLASVRHSGYAAIHLAYAKRQIEALPPGTGFVVPTREKRALSACSWVSQKWPGRAPDDCVLLRCFMRSLEASDEELVAEARREMRELLGIEATPTLTHVVKRASALPVYGLGHLERMHDLSERCADLGAVALAGNHMRGVGLSDCIGSGHAAALRVQKQSPTSVG